MGNNNVRRMSSRVSSSSQEVKKEEFAPVETFQFHNHFLEETENGLYFKNIYIPEEVLIIILSYVDVHELLKVTLVCKKWCNIIKSTSFWSTIYSRKYHKKPKKLPWYVFYARLATKYFDTNLIENGNGQKKFKHWKIVYNYGDAFKIEDPPVGSDPLPSGKPEFNGKTSCFATSYYECNKLQEISLENNRLIQLILDRFKPHIYLSEWVAARFDCGCLYKLWCRFYGKKRAEEVSKVGKRLCRIDHSESDSSDPEYFYDEDQEEQICSRSTSTRIEQWAGSTWSKIEMLVTDYPSGVAIHKIVFQHEGRDTQFWKGHYGSKMAGGVLKLLFDTMEPST